MFFELISKRKEKKEETGRRYQRVCFTKMLLEKLFFQMKKRLLWWWQWWGIHVEITRESAEKIIYIYILSSIYQRDTVFGYIVSGWERCFSGLCNCPVWLETDNILTDAYQTTSAVSALLMLLHPNTVHQIPPSKQRDHKFSVVCGKSPNSSHKFRLGLGKVSFNTHTMQNSNS